MAEANYFETGKLTDVWNPVGKNADGSIRYRRAAFDVLTWAASSVQPPETYVVPLGFERTNAPDIVLKSDDSRQIGMEFGYYGGESFIFDTHQGDGSDCLQGLHSFGPV